jgi:hypothetical protein
MVNICTSRFNNHKLYVLCLLILYESQCKEELFPWTALKYLCIGDRLCFLWGSEWILKYYLHEFKLKRVNFSISFKVHSRLHIMFTVHRDQFLPDIFSVYTNSSLSEILHTYALYNLFCNDKLYRLSPTHYLLPEGRDFRIRNVVSSKLRRTDYTPRIWLPSVMLHYVVW